MSKKEELNKLDREYERLEQYVLDNEGKKDCTKELERLNEILDEVKKEASR